MSAGFADKLDILISLAVGVGATLYGFGVIGKRREKALDPRQAWFVTAARWLGPLLVVVSAARLLL